MSEQSEGAAFQAIFGGGEGNGADGGAASAGDGLEDKDASTAGDGASKGDADANGDALGGDGGTSGGKASDDDGEPSDSPKAGEGEPDGDKLQQLLDFARTTEGRMAVMEAENRQLKEALEAARTSQSMAGGKGGQEKPEPVDIPEELKRDAEEFDALCPDLKDYLRQPGTRGDRLRKVLRDSGADVAASLAEGWAVNDRLDRELQTVRAETEAREVLQHLGRIAAVHPETGGWLTADPAARAASDAYLSQVQAWVKTLPQAEAAVKSVVLDRGSSDAVNALLDEYKQSVNASGRTGLDADAQRRAAEAGGVDNKRSRRPAREMSPDEKQRQAFKVVFSG